MFKFADISIGFEREIVLAPLFVPILLAGRTVDFISKYVAGSLLALITQWLEDDLASYLGEISDRLVLRGSMGLLGP